MSQATIHYETLEGEATIQRDDYHDERDNLLLAYDLGNTGAHNKVSIPYDRIILIEEE